MQNLAQEPTNTLCPVCGERVDVIIPAVIASHQDDEGDAILRIGTCCEACRCLVLAAPDRYFVAAVDNRVAVAG